MTGETEALAGAAEAVEGAAADTGAASTVSDTTTATQGAAGGQEASAEGKDTAAPEKAVSEAPAKKSGTIADEAVEPEKEEAKPFEWPEDWRKHAAPDDKALKTLARFTDPKAMAKAYLDLRAKLEEKGHAPAKPGPKATPEEIAEYREAMGIPESPEGYLEGLALPDDRQLGDDDKPIALSFATEMHQDHVPQSVINRALGWYYNHVEQNMVAQAEADDQFWAENQKAIKDDVGAVGYAQIAKSIHLAFDGDENMMHRVLSARDAEGRKIGGNAEVLRWLASMAQAAKPLPTTSATGVGGASRDTRIAEIEKTMREDANAYWRSEAMQKEYSELLQARERDQARSRAA